MDYFNMSKYQTIEENVLFSSKTLYELLNTSMYIDELFQKYSQIREVELNLNLERILYLSLTFLFSIGKVKINNNLIMRYNYDT